MHAVHLDEGMSNLNTNAAGNSSLLKGVHLPRAGGTANISLHYKYTQSRKRIQPSRSTVGIADEPSRSGLIIYTGLG